MHQRLQFLVAAVPSTLQGDCWKWNSSSGTGNWTTWINKSPSGQSPLIIYLWISHFEKLSHKKCLVTKISFFQWFCHNYDKVWIFVPECYVFLLYLYHCQNGMHHTFAKHLYQQFVCIFVNAKNMHSIPLIQPLLLLLFLQIILCCL